MIDKTVSIIMPVYNNSTTLNKSIESVLKQSYRNFELLIVNNGSKDNSKEIINEYNDKRIRYFEEEKPNVSNARNRGIKEAIGDYVMFIDADDFIEENALEILIKIINDDGNEVDVIMFDYYEIIKNGKTKKVMNYENGIKEKEFIEKRLIFDLISTNIWGSVWRLFIKKSIIDENLLTFKLNVYIAEDLLFNIELFSCAKKIYILKECLYNYYKNTNSTLNKYKKDNMKFNQEFHEELKNILKLKNLYENNLEAYKLNRICMYTSSISNAVRNNKKDSLQEIKLISEEYINDELDYTNINNSFLIKISLLLLKYKKIEILYNLYKLKENIRLRKLGGTYEENWDNNIS